MTRTYQGTIYPWNCDHMGHMNVQFYVAKYDQATWNLMALLGLTTEYFEKEDKGCVALEQHIKYIKEVVAGDNIFIESEIIEIKEKIILFNHTMIRLGSDEVVSETNLTGLHMDTKLRKASPLPAFVRKNFEKLSQS